MVVAERARTVAKRPSPEASVKEVDFRITIKEGILLSQTDAARIMGKSLNYFKEKVKDPTHELHKLAPYFRDVNGGKGKPSWRIRWGDLEAFILDLPRMSCAIAVAS